MRAPAPGVLPDLARAADLVAESGSALGRPLTVLASTTSTNDEAKRAAREGAPHGAAWVAEAQTAGRGRQGRAWVSIPGESLLFSVLLREGLDVPRLPALSLLAGLAVQGVVARAAPSAQARIKWPNDVVVGERKVAGILVEAMSKGARVEAVVVGVGINVHTRSFPPEVADRATSIALAAGPGAPPPDRGALLAAALAALDRELFLAARPDLGLVRARLDAVDALRGRRVREGGGEAGVASGIDDDGRLLVRRDDGVVVRWLAGEVHLIG